MTQTTTQKPQPATVLLSVSPQKTTQAVTISQNPCSREEVLKFIQEGFTQTNEKGFLSDNWIFRYDFPDHRAVPELTSGKDHSDYFERIRVLAASQGVKPSSVISLRDAFYCRENEIDLFSHQAQHGELIHAPGYRTAGTHFEIYPSRGESEFHTCRAVDIGPGVLLYDLRQHAGGDAYEALLQHCADHFFNPQFCAERLRFYDLHTFLEPETLLEKPTALNFNFNHRGRDFTFRDLSQMPLFDKQIVREGLYVKEYDMTPRAECYSLFITGESLQYHKTTAAFDIAILDQILRNGYPTQRLSPEWRFICSYTKQFEDLANQIVLCDDPAQMDKLQAQAKERARGFLDSDFPFRRQSQEQQQKIQPSQNNDPCPHHTQARPKL